jgi:hypothetical protein
LGWLDPQQYVLTSAFHALSPMRLTPCNLPILFRECARIPFCPYIADREIICLAIDPDNQISIFRRRKRVVGMYVRQEHPCGQYRSDPSG